MKKLKKVSDWWSKTKIVVPTPMRMIIVFIVGVSFLALGFILLVLPGPGILFILVGLGILGTEFAWAARALHKSKEAGNGVWSKVQKLKNNN